MRFTATEHRNGALMAEYDPTIHSLWREIETSIETITDDAIITGFEESARQAKSISQAINRLLKVEFVNRGWNPESPIFADEKVLQTGGRGRWCLDFAKEDISVEVAFNHRSDISWNLIKPTLAGELNHVPKAIQTRLGVIITATECMKAAGGFDSAVGTYEDYVQYLTALRPILTVPLIIVGLLAPKTFKIEVEQVLPNQRAGRVVHI